MPTSVVPGRSASGQKTSLNKVELKIARIWQQVLGGDSPQPFEDFFELGGDSLAAMVLALEIEATFGIQFHLSDVITHSTIAKQARTVEQHAYDQPRLPPHLTLAHGQGAKAPLFIVPGGWGFSLLKPIFIEEVGQDRPIYSFQAPGMDGLTRPLASVEQIATAYVASMRDVQPNGPYCIAAMCSGSFIALEMCRLICDGSHGTRLILLDPRVAPKRIEGRYRKKRLWSMIKKKLIRRIKRVKGVCRKSIEAPVQKKLIKLADPDWIQSDKVPTNMVEAVTQLRLALGNYNPRSRYQGNARLLVTKKQEKHILDPRSFWRSSLNGIEYQVCDCDHEDIFDRHIIETARFVTNALELPWDPRLIWQARIGSCQPNG